MDAVSLRERKLIFVIKGERKKTSLSLGDISNSDNGLLMGVVTPSLAYREEVRHTRYCMGSKVATLAVLWSPI